MELVQQSYRVARQGGRGRDKDRDRDRACQREWAGGVDMRSGRAGQQVAQDGSWGVRMSGCLGVWVSECVMNEGRKGRAMLDAELARAGMDRM